MTGRQVSRLRRQVFEEILEADKLCKFLRACGEESLEYYSPEDFDLSDERTGCLKCQLLVIKAKQVVADKKELLNSVVMDMMHDCQTEKLDIPRETCTDLVNAYGVKLVDTVIGDFPEFQTCSVSEIC